MLNFSGQRNFHDTNTILTVGVEGIATLASRFGIKLAASWSMMVGVLVIRMQGKGELYR